jgi:hypothetical protein
VKTPVLGTAAVTGAGVLVVAIDGISGHALTTRTVVPGSAVVAVIALAITWRVDAANIRFAGIDCAGVSIITSNGGASRFAITALAAIANRTYVLICTGIAFVGGNGLTLPTTGTANHLLTYVADLGSGADNHGLGINYTLIGQSTRVANESSVAAIAVVERVAIGIYFARTLHGKAHTCTLLAAIGYRAGVIVVAGSAVKLSRAPAKAIAKIVGTRVTIVTNDGETDTNSPVAVVAHGAGVAVHTFPLAQVGIGAAHITITSVGCAVVAIVAEIDVVPTHFQGLVNVAITVVVKAIANLDGSLARVTL